MSQVFIRMYVDAIQSGMLADMGAERWHTLTVLACYMDENGVCFPSQSKLAKDLNMTREAVNRRIQALLNYRWKGKPILKVERVPGKSNVYRILDHCGLKFGGEVATPHRM